MEAYIDRVYTHFVDDLVTKGATFLGKPVRVEHQFDNGKHRRFWHVVTENPPGSSGEESRNVSIHRCERVRWIAVLLAEAPSHRAKVFTDTTRGRGRQELRYTVALSDCSYVVHLSDRGTYMALITAHPVEDKRRRDKFLERWRIDKVERGATPENS